jgi:hypothetical protein
MSAMDIIEDNQIVMKFHVLQVYVVLEEKTTL